MWRIASCRGKGQSAPLNNATDWTHAVDRAYTKSRRELVENVEINIEFAKPKVFLIWMAVASLLTRTLTSVGMEPLRSPVNFSEGRWNSKRFLVVRCVHNKHFPTAVLCSFSCKVLYTLLKGCLATRDQSCHM